MKNKKIISIITGFVTGIGNGIFGSGGGTIAVPCMEKFLDVAPHKAHATAIAIILPLSVISGCIYFGGIGNIPLRQIIFTSAGGAVGGYTGAKLLGKISDKYLHIIFGCFMIIGGIRMVF